MKLIDYKQENVMEKKVSVEMTVEELALIGAYITVGDSFTDEKHFGTYVKGDHKLSPHVGGRLETQIEEIMKGFDLR